MENNVNRPSCVQLMKNVCEAGFFATDMQLYLDTHPDDTRALDIYREACSQYKACREAFENCCYPLDCCCAGKGDDWDWLMGAWPPEKLV